MKISGAAAPGPGPGSGLGLQGLKGSPAKAAVPLQAKPATTSLLDDFTQPAVALDAFAGMGSGGADVISSVFDSFPTPAPAAAATIQPARQPQAQVQVQASSAAVKPAASAGATFSGPKVYARAKFSRAAGGPTELGITAGETLVVLKQDGEWWYGSSLAGNKSGFFPGNYVEIRDDLDKAQPPPVIGPAPTNLDFLGTGAAAAAASSSSSRASSTTQRSASLVSSSGALASMNAAAATATVNLPRKLPGRTKPVATLPDLGGKAYAFQPLDKSGLEKARPVWHQPFFLDLFAGGYKERLVEKDPQMATPAVKRFQLSFHAVKQVLQRAISDENTTASVEMGEVLQHCLKLFSEACDLSDQIPVHTNDPVRFFAFLSIIMIRIKALRENDVVILPTSWVVPETNSEHGVIIIVTKTREATDANFSLAVINTGTEHGLDHHAVFVNPEDGGTMRNLAFEMNNIPNEKITNTAFWLMVFKSTVQPNPKFGTKFFYGKVLPFLSSMPILSAYQIGSALQIGINDFRPIPAGGDLSFINCVLECLRHVARCAGMTPFQADHFPMLVKSTVLSYISNDLQVCPKLTPIEIDMIHLATRCTAAAVANQVGREPSVTAEQLGGAAATIDTIEERLQLLDERKVHPPTFDITLDEKLQGITDWNWFGRLRRDVDIEGLAGDAPVPPIMRPVELTLVPDKVSNFMELTVAMRHALNLCVLLANQREIVRNSYTLRVCLIEHLFVRVVPLPLPINHPDRGTRCFWHAQPMRYETQADVLRLTNMLCRHFAAASLSVKNTRSGDAIRMLTFACIASVCDAALRKIATDVPSQSALHYSGKAKGPVFPFGFDMGNFAEESEFLKFSTPEAAAARTQVLDYFHQMKKTVPEDHLLFRFDKGNECCAADKVFIDQLCLQMGFQRGCELQFITGANQNLLDHYPEIGFFRDIVFMFKLVMVPTSDKLPELRPWTPEEAALSWGIDGENNYVVSSFGGRKLDAGQGLETSVEEAQLRQAIPRRNLFTRLLRFVGIEGKKSRSTPSQANPSILLGERVETEDDILHIRNLPDFDGCLGARDCELMLQYLTAPYMRIPLLLNFFSQEMRLKSLRVKGLQDVLDAAMFEPGQWQAEHLRACPTQVPAPTRDHLCTPTGLLFNEIQTAPNIILSSISHMLEKVIEMDTGKYSDLSDSILFVIRLAVRVEAYLLFMVRNRHFHDSQNAVGATRNAFNGAYQEATVRGLDCSDAIIREALECQSKIRKLLDEKAFKIIARWIKKSKKEGKMMQACMLHAHLAYLHRNVEYQDLNMRNVFAFLASQIFLFNNYKYDLDVDLREGKEKKKRKEVDDAKDDLGIPQVELFDMFQRNRTKILKWLTDNVDDRNTVMDAIIQLVEEGTSQKSGADASKDEIRLVRNWVSIEQAGLNFKGRFVPMSEYDPQRFLSGMSKESKSSFEVWLRETTTLAVNTEINVQLGEFTIKKNAARPLDQYLVDQPDFVTVFSKTKNDIIQCADVKITSKRRWVRLVGMGYDLQLWAPDTRKPLHENKVPYNMCGTQWIRDIVDPWKDKVLKGISLFVSRENQAKATCAVLYGFILETVETNKGEKREQESTCLKEIVVYRYPRVMQVFNIVEHGRRWYRSIVFSSDPSFSLHDMKTECLHLGDHLFQCCGDPTKNIKSATSMVILRDVTQDISLLAGPDGTARPKEEVERDRRKSQSERDKSSEADMLNMQTFVPIRFLYGIMPSALLDQYQFWQNANDSLTGYMPLGGSASQRSILGVKLHKEGPIDSTGFGLAVANATITRTFIYDDPSYDLKDLSFNITPDKAKPVLFLVNLMSVLAYYGGDFNNAEDPRGPPTCSCELADFQDEVKSLHALVRLMLRLDALSHILAWSKTDPSGGGKSISIDLIELPRLRLTFEKVVQPGGLVKYVCLEQSGTFIANYADSLKYKDLIDGLPRCILLANVDQEYFLLLPATAKPYQIKSKGSKHSYRLVSTLTDIDWLANTGESSYFVYPIHSSGCFIASRSIASSLYLLALRLMTNKYKEAFRLIESCVCDSILTPQERQIFDAISDIKDDLSVDARACRLKLYFVTFGCSDVMPLKHNVEEDMLAYLTNFRILSAFCRLSTEEEIFIMSQIGQKSASRTLHMINREKLLKASFDLTFDKFTPKLPTRNFTPTYPKPPDVANFDPVDLEELDANKKDFKTMLSKLQIVKYSRPEGISGPDAIKLVNAILDEERSLGFFYFYELYTNSLPISIIPDDTPHGVGSVLLRFLPDQQMTGIQGSILRVMESHPGLAAGMPVFEDKRKLKLPTIAGLDIFQTHIKNAAAFIKEHSADLNLSRLQHNIPKPYKPPVIIQAAPTIDVSPDFYEGRCWLTPRVTDYNCAKRLITHTVIPAPLHTFIKHYTQEEITALVTAPLNAIKLAQFIEEKTLSARGQSQVQDQSPLQVMQHPSSRSHIARTSVSRLETDIRDFAQDENAGQLPVLKMVTTAGDLSSAASIDTAVAEVQRLLGALEQLRDRDSQFTRHGITELIDFTNGNAACAAGNARALAHALYQDAGIEARLVRSPFLSPSLCLSPTQVYGRGGFRAALAQVPLMLIKNSACNIQERGIHSSMVEANDTPTFPIATSFTLLTLFLSLSLSLAPTFFRTLIFSRPARRRPMLAGICACTTHFSRATRPRASCAVSCCCS